MNLLLTSDFPSSADPKVVERIKAIGRAPRIAWIAPDTDSCRERFEDERERFAALGFDGLEPCDIDRERDDVQLAYLHEFDVIYLSGGDPIRFRFNMFRSGLGGRLRQCVAANRLIVADGGGAMLLTPNVASFRLLSASVEEVLETRDRYDALAAVPYEFVPHVNRLDSTTRDKIREYAQRVENAIIGLGDGGALFHESNNAFESIGSITQF